MIPGDGRQRPGRRHAGRTPGGSGEFDWLAADRTAIELMGIDFAKVGYLNYCAQAKLGEADLGKIEVIGERIADHIKPYRLSNSIDKQLIWMKSAEG